MSAANYFSSPFDLLKWIILDLIFKSDKHVCIADILFKKGKNKNVTFFFFFFWLCWITDFLKTANGCFNPDPWKLHVGYINRNLPSKKQWNIQERYIFYYYTIIIILKRFFSPRDLYPKRKRQSRTSFIHKD